MGSTEVKDAEDNSRARSPDGRSAVQLTAALSRRDYVAAMRFVRLRSPGLPVMVVFGLGCWIWALLDVTSSAKVTGTSVALSGVGFIVLWIQVFYVWLSPREEYKRQDLEKVQVRFCATPESLAVELDGTTIDRAWSTIRVEQCTSSSILLIPRRTEKLAPWISERAVMPQEALQATVLPVGSLGASELEQLREWCGLASLE